MANTPVLFSGKWSKITRVRTIKLELPVSYHTVRTRVYKTVSSPKSYRFTRTRTIKYTAGTFSYLHSSFIVTATTSVTGFNDSVAFSYSYLHSINEQVLQPTYVAMLGDEAGNVLGDEASDSLGAEMLFFNDSVSYYTIENGAGGVYHRNLYDTTSIEAVVQAGSPNPNRYITDSFNFSDSANYITNTGRVLQDGTTFYLQTESGSAIYTESGMGIIVTGQGLYDEVSYGYVRSANLAEIFTTTDSLSSTFIFNHNRYYATFTDSFTFNDSISYEHINVRYFNETFQTVDIVATPNRFYNYDTLSTIANVNIQQTVYRNITDTLSTSSQVNQTHFVNLSDTITFFDYANYIPGLGAYDTLTTTTSVSAQQFITRSFNESLHTSDRLNQTHFVSLSDSFNTIDTVTSIPGVSASNVNLTTDSLSAARYYNRHITDTLITSPQVNQGHFRYLSDSVSTSDSLLALKGAGLTNLNATYDTISLQRFYTRLPSETFTTSDFLNATRYNYRSTIETFTTSDSVSYIIHRLYTTSATDTLTFSDSVSAAPFAVRNFSENIPTTDILNTQQFVTRKPIDTLSSATFLKGTTTVYISLTDILPIFSDTLNTKKHAIANLTDTFLTNDQAFRRVNYTRTIINTANTTTQASRAIVYRRQTLDSFSTTDTSIIRAYHELSSTDTLTTSDSVSAYVIGAHELTDTFATNDLVSIKQYLHRTASDTFVTATSLVTPFRIFTVKITDTFTTTIGVTTAGSTFDRNLSTNIETSASLVSHKIITMSISSTVETVDTIKSYVEIIRHPQDTFYFSDHIVRDVTLLRNASDSFYVYFLSPRVQRDVTIIRNPVDSFTTLDTNVRKIEAYRLIFDAVRTTDAVNRDYLAVVNLIEKLKTLDILSKKVQMTRSIIDSIAPVNDSNSRLVIAPRYVTEALMRFDQTDRLYTAVRKTTDILKTTSALFRTINFNRLLADNVITSDILQSIYSRVRQLIENFSLNDSIERAAFYTRKPFDSSIFQDLINRKTIQPRETSELFGVTDFVLWRNTYQIAVELNEILLTFDLPDYNFVEIPSVITDFNLGDSVVFKTESGIIGRGRIVAINADSYTIDPLIRYESLYNNKMRPIESTFPIINKQDVALLPSNYR